MICPCFCVPQHNLGFVEKFGEFDYIAPAGCYFKIPCVHNYAGKLDMRLKFLSVDLEAKTSDNVFVGLRVNVNYRADDRSVGHDEDEEEPPMPKRLLDEECWTSPGQPPSFPGKISHDGHRPSRHGGPSSNLISGSPSMELALDHDGMRLESVGSEKDPSVCRRNPNS